MKAVLATALAVSFVAACSRKDEPRPPPPRVSYGTVMADVGRRFEVLGRASNAGRYDLADYELGEIEESFADALPDADPPKEGHPDVLPALVSSFTTTTIPELRKAIAAHDRAAIAAAFEKTATTCNACHQASGHGFIEVPLTAGKSVPSTDPIP